MKETLFFSILVLRHGQWFPVAGAGCAVCGAVSRPGEAEHPAQRSTLLSRELCLLWRRLSIRWNARALPWTLALCPPLGLVMAKHIRSVTFMLLLQCPTLHYHCRVSPDLQRGRLPALAQLRPPQLREARLHARHLQDHRGHGGVVRVPGGSMCLKIK